MANVTFDSAPATTAGELPAKGDQLPSFELVGTDLSAVTDKDFQGKRLVLNIFPSLDTGVCANSVREFNKRAQDLGDDTVVVNISKDLPFAQDRFLEDNGVDNVTTGSAFRSSFGEDFGVTLQDSPLQGLLSRSVVVTDTDHKVVHTELVSEITTEPNYDAAIDALK
ncbi:thiol peroxidase [Corynebacterium cystitidis]|uniref:Thiol peroxidase n=1 Tax=Corynebacterium cystitidis DSM 20524 TaxID=1121357 RepID=A0A1H9PDH2_9CORY|nr:thiol peroxidase [Corynebacterium cystitidis]WJY82535.1 putative thiol peroxidase [Corynebacterium cystitidis DSM 20524]SER46276.1 thiol peroxidase, atypical 2-Cys peroxiredoxin [Corynebacterium cystitidis DSM 20524]SNV74712.1 thiol peroxidase [Corynebacterium cystitidis]